MTEPSALEQAWAALRAADEALRALPIEVQGYIGNPAGETLNDRILAAAVRAADLLVATGTPQQTVWTPKPGAAPELHPHEPDCDHVFGGGAAGLRCDRAAGHAGRHEAHRSGRVIRSWLDGENAF